MYTNTSKHRLTLFHKPTYGVSQGSVPVPLLYILYINILPPRINTLLEPVIFADETGGIISSKNFHDLHLKADIVVSHICRWFTASLSLNVVETSVIKFIMNNCLPYALSIGYSDII